MGDGDWVETSAGATIDSGAWSWRKAEVGAAGATIGSGARSWREAEGATIGSGLTRSEAGWILEDGDWAETKIVSGKRPDPWTGPAGERD